MHRTGETLRTIVQDHGWKASQARLKYEAAMTVQEVPHTLSRLARTLRNEGLDLGTGRRSLGELQRHLDRGTNRLALALVSLGLYIASSLLMQHAVGPLVAGMPLLAIIGYGLALWFTLLLATGMIRSGRL